VSDKNNRLKEKIKKPNATAAFFDQYTEKSDITKDNNIENNEERNKTEKRVKIYNNVSIEENVDEDELYLKNLALGNKVKKKKEKKVFTSFYMDPDLASEINKMMKNAEKGDKSKLINTAIRKLLKEYGVIQ